ncbi:unnamed protein product, partial [Discosporangium mesarthrocarpum]
SVPVLGSTLHPPLQRGQSWGPGTDRGERVDKVPLSKGGGGFLSRNPGWQGAPGVREDRESTNTGVSFPSPVGYATPALATLAPEPSPATVPLGTPRRTAARGSLSGRRGRSSVLSSGPSNHRRKAAHTHRPHGPRSERKGEGEGEVSGGSGPGLLSSKHLALMSNQDTVR